MEKDRLSIISRMPTFRIIFSWFLLGLLFFVDSRHIVCAADVCERDISLVMKEYHAEKLKYIEDDQDLVHYMYESFLLGKGIVVAYTGSGREKITLGDIDNYILEVIRTDKSVLLDCEVLWGNIDGYSKAVSYMDQYTLICVCPVYRHTQEEMEKLEKTLDDIAEKWNDTGQMSREEKTKLVHDYIVDRFDYDVSLKNYDDYDGYFRPVDGKQVMVCQGYALLTYKLLSRLDVPCKIIMSETHSWNIVQLEDGLWYHLDCTNDDLGIYEKQNVYDFFLKPELSGDLYNYRTSCVLYENLDDYEFGTRKFSKTEIRYIWNRILIKHDLNFLMGKLAFVDFKIWCGCIFLFIITIYWIIIKQTKTEKIRREKEFIQYNNL